MQKELTDIAAIVDMLQEEGVDIDAVTESDIQKKKDKVKYYMGHARSLGTLEYDD